MVKTDCLSLLFKVRLMKNDVEIMEKRLRIEESYHSPFERKGIPGKKNVKVSPITVKVKIKNENVKTILSHTAFILVHMLFERK